MTGCATSRLFWYQLISMGTQKYDQESFSSILSMYILWQNCPWILHKQKSFRNQGFTQALFATSFSPEIELKMQLGVWGHCKLWLKQHSNLLKALEMALFFVCDKWYSYCIITSNSCSNILLNSWENPLQSFLLFTTPCGRASALQHYAIFDCFSE